MDAELNQTKPFVFLDSTGRPFKVAPLDGTLWLWYWRGGWHGLRTIDPAYAREWKGREITAEEAAKYETPRGTGK